MSAELSPVRIAGASEEDAIMELCRELYTESGLFSLDEDLVRGSLRRAFGKQGGIIGVIGDHGHLEAVTYMLISHMWYSREPHLEELFSFVRPDFRRSTHAKSLVTFGKKCADNLKIPLVISLVSNETNEPKHKMYVKHLEKPIGSVFLYGKHAA